MPRTAFPTAFVAEFRGVEMPEPYPNRQTGEVVQPPVTLKLERELEMGDVEPVALALRDDCEVDFEPDDLKRGELLYVIGEVNVWTGRGGTGGYFVNFSSCRRHDPAKNGKVPAGAVA